MTPRIVFLTIVLIALPATGARAADDAGTLMTELSNMVRQHGEKFARCVDNTTARHAQNQATSSETAAAASVEDCEGVLRVFVASCAQNIQALCENFAKDLRARELTRASQRIARLRAVKDREK
jgi:hypothetical protein